MTQINRKKRPGIWVNIGPTRLVNWFAETVTSDVGQNSGSEGHCGASLSAVKEEWSEFYRQRRPVCGSSSGPTCLGCNLSVAKLLHTVRAIASVSAINKIGQLVPPVARCLLVPNGSPPSLDFNQRGRQNYLRLREPWTMSENSPVNAKKQF